MTFTKTFLLRDFASYNTQSILCIIAKSYAFASDLNAIMLERPYMVSVLVLIKFFAGSSSPQIWLWITCYEPLKHSSVLQDLFREHIWSCEYCSSWAFGCGLCLSLSDALQAVRSILHGVGQHRIIVTGSEDGRIAVWPQDAPQITSGIKRKK